MKKQEILNYLAAAVVLMLAIGHVYAVVKGKVTPVRAGISTHTTYGAISTEETLTLGEPAKSRRAIAGASDVTAEKPIIIYGFYLEGRSCRISANADGSTKVEVSVPNSRDWEEAKAEDENGNVVDWSRVIIFAGYHDEDDSNVSAGQSPYRYVGEVNITMTGGKVYGIYGAGSTDVQKAYTGSIEGSVKVVITGGEVHDISNMGTSAVAPGELYTGYLKGDFTLIMTGGRYTGNTLQAIRSRVDSNVATTKAYITKSYAVIAGADFDFVEANPNNIELNGSLLQMRGQIGLMDRYEIQSNEGSFTIPSEAVISVPGLSVPQGVTVYNHGGVTITSCDESAFEMDGEWLEHDVTKPDHQWKEIVTKAATCQSAGEKCAVCTQCGYTNKLSITTIDQLSHVYGKISAHAATCVEPGNNEYEGCLLCGEPKNTNDYAIIRIDRINHNYVDQGVSEEYACGGGTGRKKVCEGCGDIIYEPVSDGAVEHTMSDWSFIYQSKDDANPHGMQERFCTICNTFSDSRSIVKHNVAPAHECSKDAGLRVCEDCKDDHGNYTTYFGHVDQLKLDVMLDRPSGYDSGVTGHEFYLHYRSDFPESAASCEHGDKYYLKCARCLDPSEDADKMFEGSAPSAHDYSKVLSIRPDANFAEAGQIQLECETCHRVAGFDYNIYTQGSSSMNTPRNPTSLYTDFFFNQTGQEKEATCITGRAPYHVSLYNGQSGNGTLLADKLDVSAVLSVVKGKHAWDADGHCRNCGESDEAYIRRQVTIQPDESSVVLTEELFETYQTLDGDNQTKWQESVMNANETEDIRVGVFCDVEWKDEMTVNKDVEFALNGHTLNVPSGIVQENQSAINVTSGTLTTPSVTGDGPKTVDRDQGASFVIDMSDDVPYSQNTQVSGVDARYARTFEVANVWQAMSVPFAVMPDAETLIGCDIAAVYFQSNPDGVELIIRKVAVDERLYANRAYLVCPKNTGKYNFTAANVTVEDAIESADNDFVCTPTTVPCQGEIFLGYDDDKQPVLVRNNNEGVKMKPFRWYVNSDALQKRLKDVPNDVRRKIQGPNGKEGYYLGKVTLTVDKSIDVVDAANLIGMLTGDKAMNVAADADNNGVTNAEDVKKVVNIILGADDAIFITTEDKVLRVPATIKSIPAVDQVPL